MLDLIFAAFALSNPTPPAVDYLSLQNEGQFLNVASLPNKLTDEVAPELNSQNYILWDMDSGEVLAEKGADDPKPIASLTKLMTGLLAYEDLDLESNVVIPAESRGSVVSLLKTFGFYVGDVYKVKDLMSAMLVSSAADAAVSLAMEDAGSESAFIEKMNTKARDLGLQKTVYEDVHGYSVGNLSSAREVSKLLLILWRKPALREMLGTGEILFCSKSERCMHEYTTNTLLQSTEWKVLGGKTGTTDVAKECLAIVIESPHGNTLVLTILGSEDRWTDARTLLRWAYKNYAL